MMIESAEATKVSERAERQLVKTRMSKRVRASIRSLYLRQLKIILPAIIFYYVFLTTSHYFALSGDFKAIMMGLSASAAVIPALIYGFLWQEKIRARWAHVIFIPVASLSVANIFVHVYLSGEQIQLTNGMLALMAFGFLFLNPIIYSCFMGLTIALYLFCLATLDGPYTGHFAFMMVAGFIIGTVAFLNRYRTLWRQTRFALENATKARILSRMNRMVEEQAREAEKHASAAEAASEAKSRFLANTSHELRTPLTGVLGMVDLLEKTQIDADQKEMTSAIRTSARGLLTVLNDILDFAKLESGGLVIRPEPFKPSSVLHHVIQMMQPEATTKKLKLEANDQTDPDIWLTGDSIRIGQILLNLVSNAIKYTEVGLVRIGCTLENDPTAKNKMLLSLAVTDTGIGIDRAMQASLFEKFGQVDAASNRRGAGVGLGLAISKEIADLMDATLTVDSEPDVGSTFLFSVSLETTEAPQKKQVDDSVAEGMASRPLRLLLAEDNPINQLLLKKLLNKSGWVLTVVDNGKKAVDAALHNPLPFDLILMDIQMPEMDGVTALGEIQENMSSRPPIIALTANTSEEEVAYYHEAGFDGFVGKPINESLLVREMDKVLAVEKGVL